MATFSAKAIANWFLERAERDKVGLSPMKLQKLIYFAHGWSLALFKQPLISEHPEAWDYGPVIPSIYHEFKVFGPGHITRRASNFEILPATKGGPEFKWLTPGVSPDDTLTNEFLEKVWQVYGKLSAVQLSNMTHNEGGAWHTTVKQSEGRKGVDIPDNLIAEEFVAKSNANSSAAA